MDFDSSQRRKSSASSDNGLYEPIGEPRSVCTLERVVQILNDRAPAPNGVVGATGVASLGHDNVYTAIDDDVCSFYSFQSSQSSATNPSGRGSRQPTQSGTLTSNIYDPVSLEIGDRLSKPTATSHHWNTLDRKRENLRADVAAAVGNRRMISAPIINGNHSVDHAGGRPKPPRPARPGMMAAAAAGGKIDPAPSSLDAIVENQTVASPARYHAPAAASSPMQGTPSPYSANYDHLAQSPYGRPRTSSRPLKEVARDKVMAAIHAPSTRKFTKLFSKFPRRSKSLDPGFSTRVGGEDDMRVRDPVTCAADARMRASDFGLNHSGSRGSPRKPFVKQKSVDDTLLTPSSSSSTAKEAKERKLSNRLMEMLKIDKWHRRHHYNSVSDLRRRFHLQSTSFFSTTFSSTSSSASPSVETDAKNHSSNPPPPLVRNFGSQGRLVATGSGETLVAHLERELKAKQNVPPATAMGMTTSVVSTKTTTTTTIETTIVDHQEETKLLSKKNSSTFENSSSTLLNADGKKTMRAVAPKERPKVPPPKTPKFSPSNSFESNHNGANDDSKGIPSSASSNASSSPLTVPSSHVAKPTVPKKPQFALFVQPTPPPRKVHRGPRSISTGKMMRL